MKSWELQTAFLKVADTGMNELAMDPAIELKTIYVNYHLKVSLEINV